MKKILSFLLSLLLLLCSVTAYASFPKVKYTHSVKVSIGWGNKTAYNTLPPDAELILKFEQKTANHERYTVKVTGDNEVSTYVVKVPTGKITEKIIHLNLRKGQYDLNVEVFDKNNKLVASSADNITVIDKYTDQFMDEISHRGIFFYVYLSEEPLEKQVEAVTGLGFKTILTGTPVRFTDHLGYENNYNPAGDTRDFPRIAAIYSDNVVSKAEYGTSVIAAEEGLTDEQKKMYDSYNFNMYKTPEAIDFYGEWIKGLAQYQRENFRGYPKIVVWNEPNVSNFSRSVVLPYNGNERMMAGNYTNVFRAVAAKLLKDGYDDVQLRGMALANARTGFSDYCFDYGILPLMDTFDYHPYPRATAFSKRVNNFRDDINYYYNKMRDGGGWKEVTWSEISVFPMLDNTLVDGEVRASGMVKLAAVADFYDSDITLFSHVDAGNDKTYSEHNFGIFTNSLEPKPNVPALSQMNIATNGAPLVGRINIAEDPNEMCMVYNRDGKPVMLLWCVDGELPVSFPGESFTVKDMYGNVIAENVSEYTLTPYPVYFEGGSDALFVDGAHDLIEEYNNKWIANNEKALPENIASEFKTDFARINEAVADVKSDEDAKAVLSEYEMLGKKIIALGKDKVIPEIEVSKLTYDLYYSTKHAANLYLSLYDGEMPQEVSSEYAKAYAFAKSEYKDKVHTKPHSDDILNFAKKYNYFVSEVLKMEDNPSKAGVIAAWNEMTDILCSWFMDFAAYEENKNMGLLIQIPHYNKVGYLNNDFSLKMNLINYTFEDFEGKVECYNEAGEKIAETDNFVLKADEQAITKSVKIKLERAKDRDYARYVLKCVDLNGKVVTEQISDVIVNNRFTFNFDTVTAPVSQLKSISATITNPSEEKQLAKVNVNGGDNIRFVKNSYEVEIPAGETLKLELPIAEIKETEFHFYTVGYQVSDNTGAMVAEGEVPLNFNIIAKANDKIDVKNYDGDMSSWIDAYPVYLNAPITPRDVSSWKKSDMAARIFAKWDDEHLYLLVDVCDDKHLQEFYGQSIWDDDSLQVSIDSNNDDSVRKYEADDYEMGFAKTFKGDEATLWAPKVAELGVSEFVKIIRDDDNFRTQYLIAISKDIIPNFKFTEGSVFGMNYVVNDGDILKRDFYVQFTEGTADYKNPSAYADFVLHSANEYDGEYVKTIVNEIFPSK